jgi:HlyD family secretion protein
VVILVAFASYKFVSWRNVVDASGDISSDNEIEYTVKKEDISFSVEGSGSISPVDKRVVKSEIDGTVDDIYVQEGDLVDYDQVLISLKSDSDNDDQIQRNDMELNIERAQNQLDDLYENTLDLNIFADESGIISDIDLEVGDQISANYNIGTIKDADNSYVEVKFTKEQFEKINVGDEASIFFTKYISTQTATVSGKDSTPIQTGGGSFGYVVTIKTLNPGGFSVGDLAQVTVKNSAGIYIGMENGKIVESEETDIISKLSGKVKAVNVESGQYVSAGASIAVLESDDVEFQIVEQENIIEKNKLQLNDLLDQKTVYSPMSGTVLQVDVSNDEVVDRNASLLTVANLEEMEVVLEVDELDIAKVTLGQEADIKSDVYKDEDFTGKVTKISMEGKSQNGVTTYDVTVQLDDRKSLASGMNVDVEILGDKRENVITVPIDAVNKINGEYMLILKDADGNKSDVIVELGLATDDDVEIISGIEEGDIIVYYELQVDSSESGIFGGGNSRGPIGGE